MGYKKKYKKLKKAMKEMERELKEKDLVDYINDRTEGIEQELERRTNDIYEEVSKIGTALEDKVFSVLEKRKKKRNQD